MNHSQPTGHPIFDTLSTIGEIVFVISLIIAIIAMARAGQDGASDSDKDAAAKVLVTAGQVAGGAVVLIILSNLAAAGDLLSVF